LISDDPPTLEIAANRSPYSAAESEHAIGDEAIPNTLPSYPFNGAAPGSLDRWLAVRRGLPNQSGAGTILD
jgi:hypothetical protein